MIRFWPCVMTLAIVQSAWAGASDPSYYGPMARSHGIKVGYEDRVEKDGSWRIEATSRGRGDAIDIALYRAAERAAEAGYRYVFLLGASGGRIPGGDSATVYARPSADPSPPVGCRSKKATTCYTADVAEVMRVLSGPDGNHPGMPIVDHLDEFGREVFLSGYGTGGVATMVPGGKVGSSMMTIIDGRVKIQSGNSRLVARAPGAPLAPAVVPARAMPVAARLPVIPVVNAGTAFGGPTAEERFQRTWLANQPIRHGNPSQGWTISD